MQLLAVAIGFAVGYIIGDVFKNHPLTEVAIRHQEFWD